MWVMVLLVIGSFSGPRMGRFRDAQPAGERERFRPGGRISEQTCAGFSLMKLP